MKRPIFFVIILFIICFLPTSLVDDKAFASETLDELVFVANGENIIEKRIEFDYNKISAFGGKLSNQELLNRLKNMGFTPAEILEYVYPDLDLEVNKIVEEIATKEKNSYVDVTSGEPNMVKEVVGVAVDKEKLISNLYEHLMEGKNHEIEVDLIYMQPELTSNETKNLMNLKSKFTTYIYGVNQEGRIQNIKQASSRFNGKILMPNEKLYFNEIVGDTTPENGYALAKVILNGKYTEDYGGGVCQVATTLYNSALLAGLEVLRVAPHSLKVGYVAGSFDAMVSAGISDLVIKNPYDTPIYIHAYATDAECGFKIYGVENEFQIVRRAEILEVLPEEEENIAYKSEGYLDFYKDGDLIKSEKIRQDRYKKVKIEST